MAGVPYHARAPEVVGEDAPAQRGSGLHLGVVDDCPHVVVQELASKGAACSSPRTRRRESARRWRGRGCPERPGRGPGAPVRCPCDALRPRHFPIKGLLGEPHRRAPPGPWPGRSQQVRTRKPRRRSGGGKWPPLPRTSPAFQHPGQQRRPLATRSLWLRAPFASLPLPSASPAFCPHRPDSLDCSLAAGVETAGKWSFEASF